MGNEAQHIADCATKLTEEFKPDFIRFMLDMSKDIQNHLGHLHEDMVSHILMLVNGGLCAIWLSTELSHYEPETAEFLLSSFFDDIKKEIPLLHIQYRKILERNGLDG